MISWLPATCENVLPPQAALALHGASLAAGKGGAASHMGIGNVHLDSYDFVQAAAAFGEALVRDPSRFDARLKLARCLNVLRRPDDVLAVLDAAARATPPLIAETHALRGIALVQLGHLGEAEMEFRAALAADERHIHALLKLSNILRGQGRIPELLELCERIAAHGHRHARLLLDWGRALALSGEHARAACILLDPKRVVQTRLSALAGYGSNAAFNEALAEDILGSPLIIGDFPEDEEANRGSSRLHHLMAGQRPDLIRALLNEIQNHVTAFAGALESGGEFDPWAEAVPGAARIKTWGLIQRRGAYETWHTHPGGWLSGVYYIRLPEAFGTTGDGAGCLEFGPPPSLAAAGHREIAPFRVAPEEGLLVLAPSHYHHRTIPFTFDGYRVSLAFDVVPVNAS